MKLFVTIPLGSTGAISFWSSIIAKQPNKVGDGKNKERRDLDDKCFDTSINPLYIYLYRMLIRH